MTDGEEEGLDIGCGLVAGRKEVDGLALIKPVEEVVCEEGLFALVDTVDAVEEGDDIAILERRDNTWLIDDDGREDNAERYEPGVQPWTEPSGLSTSHQPVAR